MEIFDHYGTAASLLAAAQDVTASFADVGAEIYCESYRYARFWVTVDINSSVNLQFKVLAKHTSGGADEYTFDPNKWTMRDTTLSAAGDYREMNTDADGLYLIEVTLDNVTPYLQLQVKGGTVGETAAQLDACYVTKGY